MTHKDVFKFMGVILLLCTCVFLGGCHSNETAVEGSSAAPDISQSAGLPEKGIDTEPASITGADIKKEDSTLEREEEAEVKASSADSRSETVSREVSKDIDNNGIMDMVQVIRRNDGSESFIRIYFNREQIFEYEDPNVSILDVDAFEYLDLDGDGINEIFVTAAPNVNSRPLTDVLCLKQTDGPWNRMDIPLNEMGNNGFSFKITRGTDEFDFIISSEDIEQAIHFDAAQYFHDDESGNIDTIKAYRNNHYKEGDEVGFISAWGIWAAKTGTYDGRSCIIAEQGIEGPYGHGLGQLNIYFAYTAQGAVDIMKVEHQP